MAVTIGIDPHKGSHTAVALDEHESVLGQLRVRSGPEQLARLAEWAKAWPERSWALWHVVGTRLKGGALASGSESHLPWLTLVETMGLEPTTPCVQSRAKPVLHAGSLPRLGC